MRGGVAIVLPVYNAEEYITDCLDSILAQTYPYWKAYCINDGSKDNTAFILDDYAKKDARIRVFHTPNAGAASARNFALNKIEDEEWISFIGADDYIGPSMYEFIFKAIGNEHIDYVRLFSRRTPQRYNPQAVNSDESKNVNYKIVTREEYFVNESVGGYTHSLFVKKGIVDDHQVSFPEKMVMLEDQAFSIACATHAKKILILDQPRNYFYYSGNESSITRTSKDTSNDIIRCLNIVYKAFKATGSSAIINDYFYRKYLPVKLDSLYSKRLHYRHIKLTERLLPEIRLRIGRLSFKTKIKYIIVKIFRLI